MKSFSGMPPVSDDGNTDGEENDYDPRNAAEVQESVRCLVARWGQNIPSTAPNQFLNNMLAARGYDVDAMKPLFATSRKPPSLKQMQDYDNELVWAIRHSNFEKVFDLYQSGRSMNACNKFSESIVHMACRRSTLQVVAFILTHGGDSNIVDDYGRTPLHDACWRTEPAFDVVTCLLDRNPELVRQMDARGSLPLSYVCKDQWTQWCAYLFHQRDKYWPDQRVKVITENIQIVGTTCPAA